MFPPLLKTRQCFLAYRRETDFLASVLSWSPVTGLHPSLFLLSPSMPLNPGGGDPHARPPCFLSGPLLLLPRGLECHPLSSFLLPTLPDPSREPPFTPLLNGDDTRNLVGLLGELHDTGHVTCLGQCLAQSETPGELIVTPAADQSLISREGK